MTGQHRYCEGYPWFESLLHTCISTLTAESHVSFLLAFVSLACRFLDTRRGGSAARNQDTTREWTQMNEMELRNTSEPTHPDGAAQIESAAPMARVDSWKRWQQWNGRRTRVLSEKEREQHSTHALTWCLLHGTDRNEKEWTKKKKTTKW